jgi:hypothetical protein
VAVAAPTEGGSYTVTATLANPNYTAPAATGNLVIGPVSPTLTWAGPANLAPGTAIGAGELDAVASFNGQPIAGTYTYSPAAGTVLPSGVGQTLSVTFTPTDSADFRPVTASVLINVASSPPPIATPTPTPSLTDPPAPTAPSPLMILGAQSLLRRPTNPRGKPVGKPVLTGFTFTFSAPLDPSSAANPAYYRVDTIASRHVKVKDPQLLRPVSGFTISYNAATDSVTLTLVGKQTFQAGGQIAVIGGAGEGVAGTSGTTLAESANFSIAKGGKTILPS